jgi:hypothetical protein
VRLLLPTVLLDAVQGSWSQQPLSCKGHGLTNETADASRRL